MDSNEGYIVFVVLGVVLVAVVGMLLTRGGKAYLEDVFRDRKSAGSVSTLLTVLFYLFALGILGVISTIDVPTEGAAQTVVTKLGIVLLILGVVFGSTMLVLNRIRARREVADTHDALFSGTAATPPMGTPAARPADVPPAAPAAPVTERVTEVPVDAPIADPTVPPQRMSTAAQAAADGHARRGHVIR